MIITIHQPEHLPWLGLFNKMAKAEVFVILDSVQYEKNYFQNRNRIVGTNGIQWINIPVNTKGHMDKNIAQIEIAENGSNIKWREKYLRTITMSYGKYPFYSEVFPLIEQVINLNTKYFCNINIGLIKIFNQKLGIFPQYIRSSELSSNGLKSNLILNICKEIGADTYIAGPSGRNYLDMNSFKESKIDVRFNDFIHPVYPQRKCEEFISHLSAVDLFMNCGFDEGKKIIMKGNEGLSRI